MWSIIRHYRTLTKQAGIHKEIRRLFLSDSFKCEEAWTKRLNSPILQKVSLDDLFYEIDNKFDEAGKASPIDIDIFVNAVNSDNHVDEMEDLVHRFRLSSEAANILDSTHHAFIRNYLDHGDVKELMRVLNDRLNYGIFPDKYCTILLMNKFIKDNDFTNAAKVAVLQMLQEEFDSKLINYLSLFSCHSYLLNPSEWEEKIENEPEDDGEEVKVRVKYLRNPFFDDHFDLREPNHLIGKTFSMISDNIDEPFKASYKLLGLILYNKLKEAEDYLSYCVKNNVTIYLTAIELSKKCLDECSSPSDANANSESDHINNLKKGLELLIEKPHCAKDDLLITLQDKIKSLVSEKENSIIEEQIQIYEEWDNKRESELRKELEELHRLTTLKEIEDKKEELKRREEELFFFEKENELELAIDSKWVRYPKKWLGKKKKKRVVNEEYVPPEITKSRSRVS